MRWTTCLSAVARAKFGLRREAKGWDIAVTPWSQSDTSCSSVAIIFAGLGVDMLCFIQHKPKPIVMLGELGSTKVGSWKPVLQLFALSARAKFDVDQRGFI